MNIIFNGPPGSGKDEACIFLEKEYGILHRSFKEVLFTKTIEFFDVDRDWFMDGYDNRKIKEQKEPKLNSFSRREAMIHVSENIIKPLYGKDFFGKYTAESLDRDTEYCFSDGGFIDEVTPVINKIGTNTICIVQLFRHGCSFSSDSRNYLDGIFQEEFILGYKSETKQVSESKLPIRMYKIYNNASVEDFHKTIREILRKEANVIEETNAICGKPV